MRDEFHLPSCQTEAFMIIFIFMAVQLKFISVSLLSILTGPPTT
jgi:hypothetical protein